MTTENNLIYVVGNNQNNTTFATYIHFETTTRITNVINFFVLSKMAQT